MKIGLNATCIGLRPSGAKQRFIGIYAELFKRMPYASFSVYQARDCDISDCFASFPYVEFIKTPIPIDGRIHKFIASQRFWPKAFKRSAFDLFEGYHLPFTAAPGAVNILTMHDIRGVSHYAGPIERLKFGSVLQAAFHAADHVITVSESMRREILRFAPGQSTSVIYNGIDHADYAAIGFEQLAAVKEKFDLPNGFLLAVGHFEQRKNYGRLIAMLALLNRQGRNQHLVIVGNESGESQLIGELIARYGLSAHVTLLHGISDDEVRGLYRLAGLFIFPSYYEGFGIPVLEAMASDCPMVLSDIPVFREITRNKGVYFTYDDVPAMAKAVISVLDSAGERQRLIQLGRKQVEGYNFPAIAAELEALYHRLTDDRKK